MVPIYEQITEKFKVLILKGVMRAGEQMPSVRSLAMELSINPNTIQKAYTELERQGFIYTVKGRGNFIAGTEKLLEEKKKNCLDEILKRIKEAMEYGVTGEEILSVMQQAVCSGAE